MPAPRRLAWVGAAVVAAVIAAVAAIALRRDPSPAGDARGTASRDGAAAPGGSVPAGSASGSTESAEQLVAAARAAGAAGDLAQARALLARAYTLDPAPATLLDLADAELAAGHCREARRATQRVIEEAPAELAERARQLLARIGRCD